MKLLQVIEALIDYSWEKLNTNFWICVEDKWRYLYGYCTLYKVLLLSRSDDKNERTTELIQLCDMGLLMSGPLLEKQFNYIIKSISKYEQNSDLNGIDRLVDSNAKRLKTSDIQSPSSSIELKLNEKFLLNVEYSPSVEIFNEKYVKTNTPVIIDGQMGHWPAMQKWNIEYILNIGGKRTVPIEIGSKYTEDNWSQKLMTIGDFISKYVLNEQSTGGYLAQHPLFDQVILSKIKKIFKFTQPKSIYFILNVDTGT